MVWGNRFVSESALTSRIKAARRAIGDNGRSQVLIRTVHGRGYQFIGEVRETVPAGAPTVADVHVPESPPPQRDPVLHDRRRRAARVRLDGFRAAVGEGRELA